MGPFAGLAIGYLSQYMLNKYKECAISNDTYFDTVKDLRNRLKNNGGKHMISDHLTYPEIVLALALPNVKGKQDLGFSESDFEKLNGKDIIDET